MSEPLPWFGHELQPLLAVAAATLERDSTLIEANAGFLRLIAVVGRQPIGTHVDLFFLQPDFATLAGADSAADGDIYRGLMTIGAYAGKTRSLTGRVWRSGTRLHLLAEYDVDDLERLADTALGVSQHYADAHLELARTNLKLQRSEARSAEAALTDALTGIGNRHLLEQSLQKEIARSTRSGDRLCACMADLDFFKRVNDTYGHDAGDKVLAFFGKLLRGNTRPTDTLARFGGEEFFILMPHTSLDQAMMVAERIRAALASHPIEPLTPPVTASFGVGELAAGESAEGLLQRIDKALYVAKEAGRNRVAAATAA